MQKEWKGKDNREVNNSPASKCKFCVYILAPLGIFLSLSLKQRNLSPIHPLAAENKAAWSTPVHTSASSLPIFLILGTASKEILRFCSRWVSIEFQTVSKNLRKTHSFHQCNAASIPRPLLHQKEPAAAAAPAPLHELTDTSKAKDVSHQVTQPQHFMGSLVYS